MNRVLKCGTGFGKMEEKTGGFGRMRNFLKKGILGNIFLNPEKKEDVLRPIESYKIVLPLCYMMRTNHISQKDDE